MKKIINWKLYFTLLIASIISIVAVLPYAFNLAGETIKQSPLPFPAVVALSIVQSSILFAIVIFFGLKLSQKVGLGLPILEEYLTTKKLSTNFKSILKNSILWGIIAGAAILLLDFIFTKSGVGISLWTGQMPPSWIGFLASFYGGISEELLLRLFFMTFLVWLFGKFRKSDQSILKSNFIMWSSIIISTALFGLGHLPITSSVTALTSLVVARAIVLNGVGGMIFGWLYWKKGLESAMIAHFSTDIILHVIFPALISLMI